MAEQQEFVPMDDQEQAWATMHQVFSLRRGGHHAVMGWLQGCYESAGYQTAHANNVYEAHLEEPAAREPRALSGDEVLKEAREDGGGVLFVNYEDLAYSRRQEAPSYVDLQERFGARASDILVVRDFYNLMASRLTVNLGLSSDNPKHLKMLDPAETAEVWTEFAKQLDPSQQGAEGQPLSINYNRWVTEESYGVDLAGQLGIAYSDAGRHVVRHFGGGSSFDGTRHNGNAGAMNVLQRWTDLDPRIVSPFRRILESAGEDVHELNERHFGIRVDDVLGSLATQTAMP